MAAVFCPLCGSLWLCWCGVCSCCPAVVWVYSIDRGGGWCRLGLPSNYDSAPTDRHTPKTAERRQAAHDGGRRTASKRPGGLPPGGGRRTAAQAAGSGLSSRKIEKETKRTKYYLICIDNHLFSCYTYPTKTKEVHYGTQ